jgi:hypothetical protein
MKCKECKYWYRYDPETLVEKLLGNNPYEACCVTNDAKVRLGDMPACIDFVQKVKNKNNMRSINGKI